MVSVEILSWVFRLFRWVKLLRQLLLLLNLLFNLLVNPSLTSMIIPTSSTIQTVLIWFLFLLFSHNQIIPCGVKSWFLGLLLRTNWDLLMVHLFLINWLEIWRSHGSFVMASWLHMDLELPIQRDFGQCQFCRFC